MASGIVRSFISEYCVEAEGTSFSRLQSGGEFTAELLKRISANSDETTLEAFDTFSEELVFTLKKIFTTLKDYKVVTTQQEKLWREFHSTRSHILPTCWKVFCERIGMNYNRLAAQTINLKIFESLMKTHFSASGSNCQASASDSDVPQKMTYSDDELNALRYVSGYVPHVLLKRYEKRTEEEVSPYLTCLGNMAVAGDESSIHNYTTKWIEKVNRGGLFPVNDDSFCFFLALESIVRHLLCTTYKNTSMEEDSIKRNMIEVCLRNGQVQQKWSTISKDVIDPQISNTLLKEVITLWITIRGFSLAATWLESYKKSSKKDTKKSKRLRKMLTLK